MNNGNASATILGNQIKNEQKPQHRMVLSKTQKIVLIVNLVLILLCLFVISFCFCYARISMKSLELPPLKNSALAIVFDCDQSELIMQTTHYSDYWLIRNYFIGTSVRDADCGSVTYVTHSEDLHIFNELPELAKSWQAPISVMLFAPGSDFFVALSAIQYARNCLPESVLITQFVTFHIFFPFGHTPKGVPHTEKTALAWPFRCSAGASYMANNTATYAQSEELNYPVNVARNLARRAVNTHFVLMSDAINKPSGEGKMVQTFLDMQLEKFCPSRDPKDCDRAPSYTMNEVFVLPVYQLTSERPAPVNAAELKRLIQAGHAKPMDMAVTPFIGHRYVPYYDERFVVPETKWHNLLQYYAMCLQHYKYKKLPDDLFLIYKPKSDNAPESVADTARAKDLVVNTFKQEYLMLFGLEREKECKTCMENEPKCFEKF